MIFFFSNSVKLKKTLTSKWSSFSSVHQEFTTTLLTNINQVIYSLDKPFWLWLFQNGSGFSPFHRKTTPPAKHLEEPEPKERTDRPLFFSPTVQK
jgi:hypothetical protein